MNSILDKIKKLPEIAQDHLFSKKGVDLNALICDKFNLKGDKIGLNTDLVVSLYIKEKRIVDIIKYAKDNFLFDDDTAREYALDLVGYHLLIVKDIFDENIENFISNHGKDASDYKKVILEREEDLKKEKEDLKKEKEAEEAIERKVIKKAVIDLDKEKKDSLEVFQASLKSILVQNKNDYLPQYNLLLIRMMLEDSGFKKALERSLYHNEEKLTTSKFKIDGKDEKPTIGNWLKDFIKKFGTKRFSDVIIVEYITKSENTKNLYTNERIILNKLLQLYRNVKFFPEVLNNKPENEWEIIPSSEINEKADSRKVTGPPKTTAEKNIEILEDDASKFKEGSLEKLAIDEEIEHEKRMEELRFMATKFADGSLEKKAIEEELKKMEHNK